MIFPLRQNSFNRKKISLTEHKTWFESILNSTDIILYILYEGNIPVGEVRIERKGEAATISYSIDKEYRGHGYGEKIIKLLKMEIRLQKLLVNHLVAKVLYSNIASQRIFEKLGYMKINYDDHLEYSKNIVQDIVL